MAGPQRDSERERHAGSAVNNGGCKSDKRCDPHRGPGEGHYTLWQRTHHITNLSSAVLAKMT